MTSRESRIRDVTYNTLSAFDVNMSTKGVSYIVEAMVIIDSEPEYNKDSIILSNLKIDIGLKFKTTESKVERSIRTIFNKISMLNDYDDNPLIKDVFKNTSNFKQGNMIALLYKYVSDSVNYIENAETFSDSNSRNISYKEMCILRDEYSLIRERMIKIENILKFKGVID